MISEFIIVDGMEWRIPILSVDRQFPFLDKAAERNLDGKADRELIGVFRNHRMQFGSVLDTGLYAAFIEMLTEPLPFRTITVPGNDTEAYTYTAYTAEIADRLRRLKSGKAYWQGLSMDFIAREPWKRP